MVENLTSLAYWTWPELLSEAFGRALAALGAGTAIALLLIALTLGVEALRDRSPRRPKPRLSSRPQGAAQRRRPPRPQRATQRRRPPRPPLVGKRRGAT